jgi:hypothetical protein
MVNRSVISGSNGVGINVGGGLAASEVNISNSVISSNPTGVQNAGGTVTIRLNNNDIAFNSTAISGATQGNGQLGTEPSPIGAARNPTGLQ